MPEREEQLEPTNGGEAQDEQAITLIVVVRNWDINRPTIEKTIFEFTAKDKHARIHSPADGVMKVLIDVGNVATLRKAGLVVDGKEIRVPPQGLIINL